ncbi:MAG TPA: hypothetical protein VM327_05490 [Candidatus Thermoplasmatota archaeon]|nr:hypothetical protein [Candidatus Thermoplasmatota archaeon]
MASERRLVEAALDDAMRMGRWRILGRRARLSRLYFELRAEGVGWLRARRLVWRSRKALRGLRKEPVALDVALDLILA